MVRLAPIVDQETFMNLHSSKNSTFYAGQGYNSKQASNFPKLQPISREGSRETTSPSTNLRYVNSYSHGNSKIEFTANRNE
jgi:hypothetical protein